MGRGKLDGHYEYFPLHLQRQYYHRTLMRTRAVVSSFSLACAVLFCTYIVYSNSLTPLPRPIKAHMIDSSPRLPPPETAVRIYIGIVTPPWESDLMLGDCVVEFLCSSHSPRSIHPFQDPRRRSSNCRICRGHTTRFGTWIVPLSQMGAGKVRRHQNAQSE